LDDTDNIKKIISANSALSFQEKRNRFGDAGKILQHEINKKNQRKRDSPLRYNYRIRSGFRILFDYR
jgi:hypothetical protein